jgi:hypothetical protein
MADIFTDELQAALAAPGCPICRVVTAGERLWMDSFWREGKNDRDARAAFFAAGGFCREHALLLQSLARDTRGGAAVADLYRWLAKYDIELLARASQELGHARRRRRLQLARRRVCPACEEAADATERKLSFLIDVLGTARAKERYAASDGLCLPHLLQAAAQAATEQPEISRFLLDDGRHRLANLRAQLDEFDRKRDHRFRDEPKGTEQLAPAQAIRRYAGDHAGQGEQPVREEAR